MRETIPIMDVGAGIESFKFLKENGSPQVIERVFKIADFGLYE